MLQKLWSDLLKHYSLSICDSSVQVTSTFNQECNSYKNDKIGSILWYQPGGVVLKVYCTTDEF